MGISSSVGLASGLETESLITSLMTIERAPITQLQKKQSVFQAKISSYGLLKSSLSSLQTAVKALKTEDNYSASYSASSSNKDMVSVSVTDAENTSAGTYKIKVNQLATSAQMTSHTFTENDSTVGTGTIHFKVGDGDKQSIAIDSDHQSLDEIAKAINDADSDVSASVLRVAENDYRLTLTAKDTGKDIAYSYQETGFTFDTTAHASSTSGETMKSQAFDSNTDALGLTGVLSINGTDITLTGTESLNDIQTSVEALAGISTTVDLDSETGKYSLSVTNDASLGEVSLSFKDTDDAIGLSHLMNNADTVIAKKAIVNINNIDVERTSNTITDLISGLTLNLEDEDPTETVSVSVTANHDTAKSKMEGFVEAYNSVVKSIDSLQSYNSESGAAGNLLGDSTTNALRSSMRRMIFTSVSGVSSNANSLSRLGIEVEETGLLSFNSDTFTRAINNNPDDVKNFFTSDAADTKGLAVQFDNFISGYMDSRKGVLASKIDGYTASSKGIDSDIERIERKLVSREQTLRNQFTNLEKLMSTFNSTASYMDSQLSALSNMTSKFK